MKHARWSEAWALDRVTEAEARVMAELLIGSAAPASRRQAGELMLSAAAHGAGTDVDRLRTAMTGSPSDYAPPAHLVDIRDGWRRVQVRQLVSAVP